MTLSSLPHAGARSNAALFVGAFLFLLVAWSPLALLLSSGQETYPNCVDTPGASAVPHGLTASEWRDQLSAAAFDGQEIPQICLPPPGEGELTLSDPVDQLTVLYLNYTARDWGRWDSFDATQDFLATPTKFGSATENTGSVVWGIGNGKTSNQPQTTVTNDAPLSRSAAVGSQPLTSDMYLQAVRSTVSQTYYPRGYAWFRGYGKNPTLDYINEFARSQRYDLTAALINTSFAINENYNLFRTAKKATLRTAAMQANPTFSTAAIDGLVAQQFDALTIDWLKDIPRNQYTMDWYERYLMAVMAKQVTTPGQVTTSQGSNQVDAFGLFTGFDGAGYRQDLMFFYSGDWAYMSAHYLKMLRTPIIRKLRTSIYAQFASLYSVWKYRGSYENRLSSQWLLTLSGWTCSSYFILKSEAELRKRGAWVASDEKTSTNWPQGSVTNADMLAMTEKLMAEYTVRMQKWGLTESLSTYYGYVFDVLGQMLLHAPSQKCYDLIEQAWKMLWFDLASNFHPGSGAYAGPSGRHYDLTTGLHSKVDLWDTVLYVAPMYPPNCAFTRSNRRGDGVIVDETLNLCTPSAQKTVPFTLGVGDFNMVRFQQAAVQAAGFMYMPYDALVNVALGSPYRTLKALTTNQRGQERHNFIGPSYQLGFGAEETYGVTLANIIVGRLSGTPKANTPTAVVRNNEPSQTHAYLRQMPENSDDAFFRDGTTYGVVSHGIPILGRFLSAQDKNFMLTTSFIAGLASKNGGDMQKPFNTDIIMPLTVDALYADNYPLPISSGTIIALPPNVILTARHGNATMVVRILHLDVQSNIKTATSPTVLTDQTRYAPTKGLQEYSLTWQVDSTCVQAGAGRVTIHHKNRGENPTTGGWRISTLWATGDTFNDRDMWALQRSVRQATFTESITPQGGWNPSDQPWSGRPSASWDGSSTMGSAVWTTEVKVGSMVKLSVSRTDTYQPNTNDAMYKHSTAPLHAAPFYFAAGFTRLSQGADIFPEFNGATGSGASSWTGVPMVVSKWTKSDVAQPHLTEPVACRPGVDFPCAQWSTSAWSACSVSCFDGVQTRTATCVDASKNNAAISSSLCPSAQPSLQQACNLGTCNAGPPTILKFQAQDQALQVWWNPPAFDGGSPIVRYVALVSPGDITVTSTTSPLRVGGLTNGVSYTVKISAVNGRSAGPYSAPSDAIVPDVYTWVYSAWTGCSSYCGGGQQKRTVSCSGTTTGPAPAAMCVPFSDVPTDLVRDCNTAPCAWIPQPWSACSAVCSSGTQTRALSCSTGYQIDGSAPSGLPSSFCTASAAPATSQPCNTQACGWLPNAWTDCSKTCGGGIQTRTLQCTDGNGGIQSPAVCTAALGALATQQACNTAACLPHQWLAKAWSDCSATCGGGTQSREVTCATSTGSPLADSECDSSTKPSTSQACGTAACTWKTDDFGACSAPCGGGTQTRAVTCTDPFGANAPTSRCASSAPASSQACNTQSCTWITTPFSDCSVTCGVGQQTRTITCSDTITVISDSMCDAGAKPTAVQMCSASLACPGNLTPPKLTSIVLGWKKASIFFEIGADQIGGYIVRAQSSQPVAAALIDLSNPANINNDTVIESDPNTIFAYGTTSPIEVVGLVSGVKYKFKVDSTNALGQSDTPAWSDFVETYDPPAAPTIVDISVPDGTNNVIVKFTPGAVISAAQPTPTFTVVTEPAGGTATGTESPLTITNLPGGVNYTIVLYATNPSGDSTHVHSDANYTVASLESGPTPDSPIVGSSEGSGGGSNSSTVGAAVGATFGALGGIALALAGVWGYRKYQEKKRTEQMPVTSSAAGSAAPSNEVSRVGEYHLEENEDHSGHVMTVAHQPEEIRISSIPPSHGRTPSQVRIEIGMKNQPARPLPVIPGSPNVLSSPSGVQGATVASSVPEPWSMKAGYSPVALGHESMSPSPSPPPMVPASHLQSRGSRSGPTAGTPVYSPVFHE